MKFIKTRHEPEDLNISPLIDMVFILLIFFAVSTTFVKDMKLDLERPSAQTSVSASNKSIRVYIDRQGDIFLNEKSVKPWMLQSLIRDSLSISSTQTVLVIADRLTSAENLIEVVDQCKLGGAREVGVATLLE
jgi:biopolymer transport protein ExbD